MGKLLPPLPRLPPKVVYVPPTVDFSSAGLNAEVDFSATGLASLEENLRNLPDLFRDAAGTEMAIMAREVIVSSQENFVPVETGALSESADSDEYKPGTGMEVTDIHMWYAGELTVEQVETLGIGHGTRDARVYALEQHENMEFKHNDPGRPQAGAKYLERPFVLMVPTMEARIAAAINEATALAGFKIS